MLSLVREFIFPPINADPPWIRASIPKIRRYNQNGYADEDATMRLSVYARIIRFISIPQPTFRNWKVIAAVKSHLYVLRKYANPRRECVGSFLDIVIVPSSVCELTNCRYFFFYIQGRIRLE